MNAPDNAGVLLKYRKAGITITVKDGEMEREKKVKGRKKEKKVRGREREKKVRERELEKERKKEWGMGEGEEEGEGYGRRRGKERERVRSVFAGECASCVPVVTCANGRYGLYQRM